MLAALLLVPGFLLNLKAAFFILLLFGFAMAMETRAGRLNRFSFNKIAPYLLVFALGGLSCAQVILLLIEWINRQPLAIIFFILGAPILLLMFLLIFGAGFALLFCVKVVLAGISRGRLTELWLEFSRAGLVKKLLMLALVVGQGAGVYFYILWLVST